MEASTFKIYFKCSKELEDASIIICPECKEATPLVEWPETDSYCEVCGDHPATVCPKCDAWFDHVYTDQTFEIKTIE